jgi:hypothetical protein
MNLFLSANWFLAASAWYLINGVLHDVFVIRAHKGGYDRELLRLLMDGHVLILSGVIMFLCWHMVRTNIQYGAIIGLILAVGMIVYCLMIFPFLKSFVTLALSILLAIVCSLLLAKFRQIATT